MALGGGGGPGFSGAEDGVFLGYLGPSFAFSWGFVHFSFRKRPNPYQPEGSSASPGAVSA